MPPLAGIGASAGGIEALESFFQAMPDDPGLAFVVVLQLDGESPKRLGELLSRQTRMPVVEDRESAAVEANHIYIAPPGSLVEFDNGRLRATSPDNPARLQSSIDHLFHSLASELGEAAIGIVLSGAGSDGTLGLQAIADAGGMTMAQSPESARFESMPRCAVAAGVVDHVLRPEELARTLLRLQPVGQRGRAEPPDEPAAVQAARGILLDEFVPPYVVVSEHGRIVARSPGAERYLESVPGDVEHNINCAARDGLRLVVRAALSEAARQKRRVVDCNASFQSESGAQRVRLTVQPIPEHSETDGLFLIVFEDHPPQYADDALRQSEVRFASFMRHLPGAAWIKDELGRYVYANEYAQRIFQSSMDELSGKRDEDLFPIETARRFQENDRRAAQRAEGLQTVEFLQQEDGIVHESLVSKFPILADDGGLQYVGGIAIDVTEQRRAEASLRDSEARLTSILANTTACVFAKDLDGRYIIANPSLSVLFGWPDSSVALGKTDHELFDPETADAFVANDRRVLEADQPLEFEELVESRGERRIFLVLKFPMRDHAGDVYGLCGIATDITDRKRAAAALLESEERLRFTLNAARVGSWDWNIETGEVKWSDNMESVHGRSPGTFEQTFESVVNEVYPPDQPKLQEAVEEALSGSGSFEVEYRIVRDDGAQAWLHGQGHATFQDGRPVRMAGICMDVTERRRADEMARLLAEAGDVLTRSLDHETTLRGVADLIVPELGDWCAIDLVTPEGRLESVAVAHSDPDRIELARELRRRYPPDLNAPRGVANVVRGGLPEVYEDVTDAMLEAAAHDAAHLRILRELKLRSALVVPLLARGRTLGAITLVSAESGRRYSTSDLGLLEELADRCALAVDNSRLFHKVESELSERSRAEAELRDRTAALEAINRVNTALAGELDLERLVQEVTDAGTELTRAEFGAFFYNTRDEQGGAYLLFALSGASREEFQQFPMPRNTELFNPTFRGEGIVRLDDVTRDRRYGRNAPYFGLPDGHLPVRSYLAVPVVSRTGEVHGALFFGHGEAGVFTPQHADIMAGVAAQAAVAIDNARLFEAAERANQSKTEFLANMSHEIRTPMTAILGYTDVLMAELANPEHRQHLQTIKRNGRFLLEIINDVLDVSKIEAGRLEIRLERCSPVALLDDALSLMDVRAREKRLNLAVEYASAVPESIETDPVRLRQILINLVGNAIKFTEQGSVRVVVCFQQGERRMLQIGVIDTGIGMSHELQRRLFQPFTQADASNTRRFGGTGLGLTICRRLVDMLGGDISFESAVDRGTRFTIQIPTGPLDGIRLVDPHGTAEGRTVADVQSTAARLDCHVLVVDDSRDIRRLARRLIESAGGKVSTAHDGLEAIDAVRQARADGRLPDVVLMDIQMPLLDGYEATRRLRVDGFAGPILAVTAGAMRGDRERCLEAGCTDYLSKPIDRDLLIGLISRYASSGAGSAGAAVNPVTEVAVTREPLRILLVDDSADACRATAMLLELSGYDVRTEHTGRATVATARDYRPHVVLLDLNLPDLHGCDVCRQLRQLEELRETVVIALTGSGEDDVRQRTRKAGFDHHIIKPADLSQLEALFPGIQVAAS